MQGACEIMVPDAADWFQDLMFQDQRGLIMTSTYEHVTDMKCKLVYCVNSYSVYSNYLWKLGTAAICNCSRYSK
jgi:hypothetical protein